jgi:hypothetical protein
MSASFQGEGCSELAANLLRRGKAQRMAANFAKQPELLRLLPPVPAPAVSLAAGFGVDKRVRSSWVHLR